ncbi:putative quinol monooxygenase [Homoserinibacter sp. YIM 151385]|uniref:putative quinol monooxygenase n=1 Tax=Homoserinibacter sp. YIM 151385 TaxID=2985506 RepID=UPI0022F097A1|nr:antibiotic biosynthesis monooxygenase family protein [Homoserinibacter sp. YIM 151385]WBU38013.1 antibiotic biosynthesis monooxygenase [Homoserinibacter sp. YIM 151385]
MSSPVIVTAVFHPAPGAKERLIEAMGPGIAAVHAEPGCELYAIHDAEDGTITMIERWTSAEDLAAHAAGEAIALLNRDIDGLLASPVVVTRMSALPAGDAAKGVL